MAKELLVTLENQPGEGARLGEALGDAGVNIEGLCAIMDGRTGTVHILVEDVAGARAALEGAGIPVEAETDVIVSPALPDPDLDTPGVFGGMARALADAGINITLVYVASRNRVVLATDDNQRATQLLQSMM
ncbi:amino acid-binding protein [Agromyces badenianii]|uniref:Amino acid-binding protein n=1 Tax=Agromyces badenianii TaxID=2080742 RepID=A0A2S0WTT5_9MICO|nr:amino acid-binding protein [Agromyces badenianii]AWB94722.1 amino acid-binding protein [Agromyces badenianii]